MKISWKDGSQKTQQRTRWWPQYWLQVSCWSLLSLGMTTGVAWAEPGEENREAQPSMAEAIAPASRSTTANLFTAPIAANPSSEAPTSNDTRPDARESHIAQTTSTTGAAQPIPIQGGVRYTTPGAGNLQGFTSIEGFFPLVQEPGKSVTFLEGRAFLQSNSAIGYNLLLGHRFLEGGRILGGYLAFDGRNTGQSNFNQIGVGLELLGDDFDLRLNGYFPIGTTRNQVSTALNGQTRLSGNSLFLGRTRQFEAAATVVDLEAGLKLADFDTGSLRGYLGTYYLNAPGSPTSVGARARLELMPTQFVTINVGISNDALFNTRVTASLGLTFPGGATAGGVPTLVNRMGHQVYRSPVITVADPTVQGQTTTEFTDVAVNPANGQPWFFQRVRLNTSLSGGSGTFEDPYGGLNSALAAANRPNSIVIVEPGSNPGIPSFTIPNNVSLLATGASTTTLTNLVGDVVSQALVQSIPFGNSVKPVVLASGDVGVPSVRMGNNTLLAGFAVNNATSVGVGNASGPDALTDQNVVPLTNIAIQDNTILTSGTQGLRLRNVTGNVTIVNNTIRDSGALTNSAGVFLNNDSGTVNATITGNIVGNVAATTQTQGISLQLNNNAIGTFSITNNTIAGNRVNGVLFTLTNLANGAVANATIANNTFANNGVIGGGSGIRFNLQGSTDTTVNANITNNQITGSGIDGIRFNLSNSTGSQATANIAGNTLNNNANNGIFLFNDGTTGRASYTVTNNTISNTSGPSLNATGGNPGSTICLNLRNNVSSNPTPLGSDFTLTNAAGGTFNLSQTGNTGTFVFTPDATVFTAVTSCP